MLLEDCVVVPVDKDTGDDDVVLVLVAWEELLVDNNALLVTDADGDEEKSEDTEAEEEAENEDEENSEDDASVRTPLMASERVKKERRGEGSIEERKKLFSVRTLESCSKILRQLIVSMAGYFKGDLFGISGRHPLFHALIIAAPFL